MRLKVLVDNNTYIDQYFCGEPALSFYIEDGERKILFDTGYSNVILKNAAKMNIDLANVDTIAFSHGHNDHTRGLGYLLDAFDLSAVRVVAHEDAFKQRISKGEDIGSLIHTVQLQSLCRLELTKEPLKISEHITFLGEIPTLHAFEPRRVVGKQKEADGFVDDAILDDTALVYQNEHGLHIITGCSHSGICNIIAYAKRVCKENRIVAVIGGFHLFDVDARTTAVIDYFKANQIAQLYPCHCVSFPVKAYLHQSIQIHEVGVGLEIEW